MTRRRQRELLGRCDPVVDGEAALGGMQSRYLDHTGREIDAGHLRTTASQGLREEPPAAADIEHAPSREGGA